MALPCLDLNGPSLPGSQWPFPAWISVVLPLLDLSGSALPGSQWSWPSWISVALPCLYLSGPAPPGSPWPCPSWISMVLPCLDLRGPALPGSQWPCPSWISGVLPLLDLSDPALLRSQPSCLTWMSDHWPPELGTMNLWCGASGSVVMSCGRPSTRRQGVPQYMCSNVLWLPQYTQAGTHVQWGPEPCRANNSCRTSNLGDSAGPRRTISSVSHRTSGCGSRPVGTGQGSHHVYRWASRR